MREREEQDKGLRDKYFYAKKDRRDGVSRAAWVERKTPSCDFTFLSLNHVFFCTSGNSGKKEKSNGIRACSLSSGSNRRSPLLISRHSHLRVTTPGRIVLCTSTSHNPSVGEMEKKREVPRPKKSETKRRKREERIK